MYVLYIIENKRLPHNPAIDNVPSVGGASFA